MRTSNVLAGAGDVRLAFVAALQHLPARQRVKNRNGGRKRV